MNYVEIIAEEMKIGPSLIFNTLTLFDQGSTVPFIARYRKEATGSLQETQLHSIEERYTYLKELSERKATVLKSIQEQGKLTPELKDKIESTRDKTTLEDLYLPYKPKRRTRAMAAKEAGLEPLARVFEAQEPTSQTPEQLAQAYVNVEQGVADAAAALRGALDILAEELSERAEVRAFLREGALKTGIVVSEARKEWKEKRSKFEMYYNFQEKVTELPSHRIMAMRRGEKEEVLKTELKMDDERNLGWLQSQVLKPASPFKPDLERMVRDSYERLLKPGIETEVRLSLKERAEAEAYQVFGKNLNEMLLAAPAGPKVVLGMDPGFRSGVKLAVVDATGKHLEHRTIYPVPPQKEIEASKTILLAMVESFKVDIIAIGNGTASREVDEFVTDCLKAMENPPLKVIVSEAGASVYSASPLAVKEFPSLDITIRSAISIARRVQDPLAELVKIDPKSIGVGQYQHDVNQTELKKKLEQVVETCVNRVGVDVNTASESLLGYVAGVNKTLAKNIVEYRNKNGAFKNRATMVKVPMFGPKAFEQAAGFLRVRESDNRLDESAVHPERYDLIKKICEELQIEVKELIGNKEAIAKIDWNKYVTADVGLPTLQDIAAELEKPARDPRTKWVYAKFDAKVQELKDLVPGTWMEGSVTNVTNFGAFVDIGVHQDGLVHISEIADRFVTDVSTVVSPGDIVQVRVLEVDVAQKRISLSMRKESVAGEGRKPGEKPQGGAAGDKPRGKGGPGGQQGGRPGQGAEKSRKHATVDQLLSKFNDDKKDKKGPGVKLPISIKSIMRSGR